MTVSSMTGLMHLVSDFDSKVLSNERSGTWAHVPTQAG